MQKPFAVIKNGMHKILLDFVIRCDYLMPARKLNIVLIRIFKKEKFSSGFGDSSRPQRMAIKESEKIDKSFVLDRELNKKAVEHEGYCVAHFILVILEQSQKLEKWFGIVGN